MKQQQQQKPSATNERNAEVPFNDIEKFLFTASSGSYKILGDPFCYPLDAKVNDRAQECAGKEKNAFTQRYDITLYITRITFAVNILRIFLPVDASANSLS
ncbi:hypothetical protein AVEN_169677-1 [Araneus ventricosus]|uniref:Uncharacterized protein n=1 Tax=Araneus ventricosus TaxID=182803 RepID=A0A4Y2D156_ARAVE|nr:hypothetical protein AVEN_169677-1 [Araneus ventricosus]